MRASCRLFTLLAALLAVCLVALPAQAQTQRRSWVSGTGDDGNPCTRTSPCLTFAAALSKTIAGGAINCLGPGDFGPLLITKSITISCEAGTAGVSANSATLKNTGIIISTRSTDIVYLRGLDIVGNADTSVAGITFGGAFGGAGVLHVEHCAIYGFNENIAAGINFAPTGPSKLFVSDSFIADNGAALVGAGILIRPTGSAGVNAVLNQVHVENNSLGIKVDSTGATGTVNLRVIDSIAAGKIKSNLAAFTTNGKGTANVMINRSSLSASNVGLRSDGPTTTVRIGSSVIFGNVTGAVSANGGTLVSYGNNQYDGNTMQAPLPTSALHQTGAAGSPLRRTRDRSAAPRDTCPSGAAERERLARSREARPTVCTDQASWSS